MGLINLQTNLKSLKFGHDRIDAGNSGQPYIQSPIPDKVGEFGFLNTDFVLRGGSKAVTDSLTDVARLGKYFTDVRNPSGLLFVAKQNLLSRTAVRTQASGFLLNEGVYTPLSTLIEAGGVAFGLHVNKQGLNPFGGFGGITTYSEATERSKDIFSWKSYDRLSVLYDYKILNDESTKDRLKGIRINSGGVNVLSYSGGPGSFLGVGRTNIKFAGSSASERTGANNPLLVDNKDYFLGKYSRTLDKFLTKEGKFEDIPLNKPQENVKRFLQLSTEWSKILSDKGEILSVLRLASSNIISPSEKITTVKTTPANPLDLNRKDVFVYSQEQLINIPKDASNEGESSYIGNINKLNSNTTPGDFRALLRNNLNQSNDQTQKETQKLIGNLTNAYI